MYIFLKYFMVFTLFVLFTACSDNSNEQKQKKAAHVYGTLPQGDVKVSIARDTNRDGYVDNEEFSHPLFASSFQNHYTVTDINTSVLHAIRFSRSGSAPITQNLVAGTQEINIDKFLTQYSTSLSLAELKEGDVLFFTLRKEGEIYSAVSSFNAPTDTQKDGVYFQVQILSDALEKKYEHIKAVFDVQLDPRTQGVQYENDSLFGLEISKQINYVLLDENNQSVKLKTAPTEIFNGVDSHELLAFEGQWKQSDTTAIQPRRSLIAARKVELSKESTVCIEASIGQGGEIKSLDEVQIDAIGQIHLREILADGESFELYGDPDKYTFSAKTRYISNVQESFTLEPSQQSGCDFEAKITFTNLYIQALNVHADTNGTYSLEDGYIWLHNNDYSFYSYAYLNATGDATFYVAPNNSYTLHYKNTQIDIGPNQREVTLNYIDTPPIVYSYFTKEDGELFETLNVITLDNDPLLDIEVMQGDIPLQHKSLEQSNEYSLWRFDINATVIGDNTFDIKVKDAHNESSSQVERNIPNFLPEILSVTLTDKYANVFDLNDTLYNTDYNLVITTTPDKNGHIVKTWGSLVPNSVYKDSMLTFPSGSHTLYINAYDGYETIVTKYDILVESSLEVHKINLSELPNKIHYGTYEFYVLAEDMYDENLTYEWIINNEVVSTDANLTITFEQEKDITIACNVSNTQNTISAHRSTHIYYPKPFITKGLQNKQTTEPTTFTIDAYHELEYPLNYEWKLDGTKVGTSKTYYHVPQDDAEHTLTCTVSNRYKSVETSAKIGETLTPKDLIIDTFPGNQVVIYNDDMNITDVYRADSTGQVTHSTTKSYINFAVILDQNSSVSKEMFFKFIAGTNRYLNSMSDTSNIYYTYLCEFYTGKLPTSISVGDDDNDDGFLDIDEVYLAGLEKFDSNQNGKIELGELSFDSTSNNEPVSFDVELKKDVFKSFINMQYPISKYIYKDDTFMSVIDSYIYKKNGRFVDNKKYEEVLCQRNTTYIDVIVKNMEFDLFVDTLNTLIFEPANTSRTEYSLTENEVLDNKTLSCETSNGSSSDYECTYRVYAHEIKLNGLSNYGFTIGYSGKYFYVNDVQPFSTIEIDYSDLKDLNYQVATSSNETLATQVISDGIYTVLSDSSSRGFKTFTDSEPYNLNHYWFSMNKSYYGDDGHIEYDESAGVTRVTNNSRPEYLDLFQSFQSEEQGIDSSDIKKFYKTHLDDLFYIDGASLSGINFVTYEYRLACQDTSYVEIAINLPNEYYESEPSQRFIGFYDLDTNKSIETLLPNEMVQNLEKVYAKRDEAFSECQDMKHFRLLQLKGYSSFERDAIIEELQIKQLYQLPRLQKSYYEFSNDYNYPN